MGNLILSRQHFFFQNNNALRRQQTEKIQMMQLKYKYFV